MMDNLGSIWYARNIIRGDFILLNGDTLFTADVVKDLCATKNAPVTVAVSAKETYDEDDMKVILDGGCLRAVSKDLDLADVNAESIGMMLFRGEGSKLFKDEVVDAVEISKTNERYYLSVIDSLARKIDVQISEVDADNWCEVDYVEDLHAAQFAVKDWISSSKEEVADTPAANANVA